VAAAVRDVHALLLEIQSLVAAREEVAGVAHGRAVSEGRGVPGQDRAFGGRIPTGVGVTVTSLRLQGIQPERPQSLSGFGSDDL